MRVASLIIVIMVFAPFGQALAEVEGEDSAPIVVNDVMQSYSRTVQIAFERVSDLSLYHGDTLAGVNSWLVVSGVAMENHHNTEAHPDEIEPLALLKGSYIWTFDDSRSALGVLNKSFEKGEIESFSPLIERTFSPRFEPNDPYFDDQWHLNNSGQTNGEVGEDANVTGVWDSYNGSGVVISVIDDGVEHSHPDLSDNYVSVHSYDWCGDDADPDPNSSDGHGTAVAGVAAGTGNNSIGVTGAAFGASIAGHRLIACGFSDSTSADALSYHNGGIDIYSNSWGPFDSGNILDGPGPITIAAIEDSIYNGRSGLGNIYTWAAGNGLDADDNSNYDGYSNIRYSIAVAAITHYGEQSWYSEPGANILVTAHSNGGIPQGNYEGITTTDITGSGGYDGGDITHDFGGTSSATPLVSGVIALVLEANPDLTWRDVQNILVHSSRKNDANDSSWNMNRAGHDVSHKFGFGAVDAGAAVSLAHNWSSSGEESNASFGPYTPNTGIDNGPSTWTEFNLSVPVDLRLESIDVIVDITHGARGELDIVLQSPSGHESWLAEEHTDNNADYSNWRFGTVQHWDESSQGEWKLKVRDAVSGSNSGTVNSWEVILHGVGNVTDFDGDGWPDYNDEDDDNDGWNDTAEQSCSTDPLDNSSTPTDTDDDGDCDFLDDDDDGDGLSDYNETQNHKTNPLDPDTDGDILNDYEEIVVYGTNAINPDTDNEGLDDYEEVIIYGTNPNSEDSDGDGLNDYDEVVNWLSDPLTFDPDNDSDEYYHFIDCDDDDASVNPGMQELLNGKDDDCDGLEDEGYNESDQDGDGLSDWDEFHVHGTSPINPDSDDDGISDDREVEVYGSDPLTVDLDNDGDGAYWFEDCDDNDSSFAPGVPEILDGMDNDCDEESDEDFLWVDSDGDGITDYSEFHYFSTDPGNGDSDGDGLPDGVELNELMSDPLVADPDADLDGWYHFQDCDDNDFERAPERPEELDGKDNDCDEVVDEDFYDIDTDGDGLSDYSEYHNYSTMFDSADSDQDGVDDGTEVSRGLSSPVLADYDRDNDGFYEYEDCDDFVGSTFPGAVEQWNGIDDDCDEVKDELVNRLDLVLANYEKSGGTVYLSNGEIYDGPNSYEEMPVHWDSANESFGISLSGIQSSVDATISWSMSGYSLEMNTSDSGKEILLLPINCKNPISDLQVQVCDEGASVQKIRVIISEGEYVTEIEWSVMVSTWFEPESENRFLAAISSPAGIIGIIVLLISLTGGGALIGARISRSRELQEALEAYGVSPERLAIRPENKGVELPEAPSFAWSNDEK